MVNLAKLGVPGRGKPSLLSLDLPTLTVENWKDLQTAGYQIKPASLYSPNNAPKDARYAMFGSVPFSRPVRIYPPVK